MNIFETIFGSPINEKANLAYDAAVVRRQNAIAAGDSAAALTALEDMKRYAAASKKTSDSALKVVSGVELVASAPSKIVDGAAEFLGAAPALLKKVGVGTVIVFGIYAYLRLKK